MLNVAKAIKLASVKDLIPYSKNALMHPTEQILKISKSIKQFGFLNPILVDGENGIIAGHGRLAAARLLNMAEVPVIELTHLTSSQRRAYILADNELPKGATWDQDILADELKFLEADGFDLEVIGFSDDELAGLLDDEDDEHVEPETRQDNDEPEDDEDEEIPEPEPPRDHRERDPKDFEWIKFKLANEQKSEVDRALAVAKEMGEFVDPGNDHENGNALTRVCEMFLGQNGN